MLQATIKLVHVAVLHSIVSSHLTVTLHHNERWLNCNSPATYSALVMGAVLVCAQITNARFQDGR